MVTCDINIFILIIYSIYCYTLKMHHPIIENSPLHCCAIHYIGTHIKVNSQHAHAKILSETNCIPQNQC